MGGIAYDLAQVATEVQPDEQDRLGMLVTEMAAASIRELAKPEDLVEFLARHQFLLAIGQSVVGEGVDETEADAFTAAEMMRYQGLTTNTEARPRKPWIMERCDALFRDRLLPEVGHRLAEALAGAEQEAGGG